MHEPESGELHDQRRARNSRSLATSEATPGEERLNALTGPWFHTTKDAVHSWVKYRKMVEGAERAKVLQAGGRAGVSSH